MMKAWHMLLVAIGLVDQVLSHTQTCVSPRGDVGDTYIKNCKLKIRTHRENRNFGRWKIVDK